MNLDVLLALVLIFSAACYLLIGARLASAQQAVGGRPLGAIFVIVSLWIAGSAIEQLATTFSVFSLGRSGHFVGTALVPLAAWVSFRDYTGVATSWRQILLLSILPLVSIALAASNSQHELMWAPPYINADGEFLTRPESWGPWFLFVHLPYSYGVIGVAVLGLLMHSSAVARGHRRGLLLLAAAALPPTFAAIAYDLGLGPDTFSFVPLVFAGMLPAYAWLIVGEQIVRFTPLAYETVFHNMRDPVVVVDERCRVIGLNRTAERMLHIDEAKALAEPLEELFGRDAGEVFDALDSGSPRRMLTETGRYLHVQASPIEAGHRGRGGHVLMFRDVSDVELAQQEVRRSEKLLRTLVDHSANGIVRLRWTTGGTGRRSLQCIFANAAAGRFLDADPKTLAERTAREILGLATCGMEIDAADEVHGRFDRAMLRGDSFETEVCHRHHGEGRWLRLIAEPVGDDIALTFVDITDNKARERRMESMAASDPLTGVLNRRGFERDASSRLSESSDEATGALLFIDLNNFKEINDQFGHDVGDRLLRIAAERLQQGLRSCDIIGRPGGDEFVALIPDVDEQMAEKLALRLTAALEAAYLVEGVRLYCAASIGLALYPRNANTLTGLLRDADQAMYRAKARSRGLRDTRGLNLLEIAV